MQATTQFLETNSINNHMHQIQSKALDEAIAPLFPKKPRLVLFFFLVFMSPNNFPHECQCFIQVMISHSYVAPSVAVSDI